MTKTDLVIDEYKSAFSFTFFEDQITLNQGKLPKKK